VDTLAEPGKAVSSGQMMADPSKGEFNSYVVQGELIKRATRDSYSTKR
jgi:hypothetical protein